jgi:hypothetical protein
MEYNFKCDFTKCKPYEGENEEFDRLMYVDSCGNHIVKLNDELYDKILKKMPNAIDKTIVIEKFNLYFQKQIELFESGQWDIKYLRSMDIESEFIDEFSNNFNQL